MTTTTPETTNRERIENLVLKLLAANPDGLTKEELGVELAAILGREIGHQSMKLGQLGLKGLVLQREEKKQVKVYQSTAVFYLSDQGKLVTEETA